MHRFFWFRRQYEQYRQFIDVDKTKQIVKMKLLFSLSVLSSQKVISIIWVVEVVWVVFLISHRIHRTHRTTKCSRPTNGEAECRERACSSYAEATPIDAERKREPEGQPRRARGDDEASVARSAARGDYRHHHSTQHCAKRAAIC